jgi:hypothetical protein
MPRSALPILIAAAVVIALGLTWWTLGRTGSGETAVADQDLEPFHQMRVSGAAELFVVQGAREHLTVETPTRGLQVVANVRGDTLNISIRDTRRWWHSLIGRGSGSRTTRITVTVRAIDALTVNGAVKLTASGLATPSLRLSASGGSSLQVDGLKTGTLQVSGNGALKAHLSGEATEQHVSISGAGEYQAEELASQRATINVSGVGHVVVRVERELDATISGAGNVEYVGNPVVKERVSGMGRVKRLDAATPPRGVKVAAWPLGGAFVPCAVI